MTITEFGNPILRREAIRIDTAEILGTEIQTLINDMLETLITKKLGVGLAAPQVGISKALSVIAIRKSEHRPNVKARDLVIINPEITETVGRRVQLYEGCISGGPGKASLFAKVPRYKRIRLQYYDEKGIKQHEYFEGLLAHVIQHEVDHLEGILFVDKVRDTKSYMTHKEYVAYAKAKLARKHA